jgi:hypothetical protein
MTNRQTKPKTKGKKEKPSSRQNLDEKSSAKNLLKLIITISNRHKSSSAEKAIKQKIADVIVDDCVFQHDFSDHLDDDYQPIKVRLFFDSLRYKNIMIKELISYYKRDKNIDPEFQRISKEQPQFVVINPILQHSISKKDQTAIFNFKKSKIQWLKEIQQNSSGDIDPKLYDHAMRNMSFVDRLMSTTAKKKERIDLNDLLWARAKYEVHRHAQLHRVDITQIGNISDLLTRSFCEELEKAYQDYLEEERQQNN